MLATVFAGALKVEMLLQFLLAVSRHAEEVHVADSQLCALRDHPHSSQLNPETEEDRISSGVLGPDRTCFRAPLFMIPLFNIWMRQIPILCLCMSACTIKASRNQARHPCDDCGKKGLDALL